MEEKLFYTKNDICQILGISDSKAYQMMRQLNAELTKSGYMTVRGRVPAEYFEKRVGIKRKPKAS